MSRKFRAMAAALALIMDHATEEMRGRIICPAAVLRMAGNPEAAQAFLDYLTTEEATGVFAQVGFNVPR